MQPKIPWFWALKRQVTTTWPEPPGISRPEGSEETDDFNAEGLQVAQGKNGLPGR